MLGVSLKTVNNWVREGSGPPQTPKGDFPAKEFGEWYRAKFKSDLGIDDGGQVYDFQVERARLTKAQADKAEHEAAELAGELLRVGDATLTWAGMTAAMRSKMLAIPSKLAPLIAAPDKIIEVQAKCEEMIHEALHELASSGLPAKGIADRESGSGDAGAAAETDGEPVGGQVPKAVKRVKRRAG